MAFSLDLQLAFSAGPLGGEDIFLDLFEVFPDFLCLNINGKSGAKNVFRYNPDGRCRID